MAELTPWAILLCKWQDHADDEPRTLDFYRRLFTSTGSGTDNMTDFFDQMSHGNVDLTGSQVFGWYTLPRPQTDYAGNVATPPAGQINRQGLVDLCKSTATANGVDLARFYGVVCVLNTATDLFGGGGRQALCDVNSLVPTVLGQEMGHGYGLSHSRRAGSTDDYQDFWDIMSTWGSAYYVTDHDVYTQIGPGMNAANMRGRGWLDESRVWFSPGESFTQRVQLRPLHRRDLSGTLAADVMGPDGTRLLVEYRPKARWDAAFPRSCVLIHYFEGNISYIVQGDAGRYDLGAGEGLVLGARFNRTGIHVDSIDDSAQIATLVVSRRLRHGGRFGLPVRPPRRPEIVIGGQVIGDAPVDGGGFIIIGGRIIPIPPWNPMARVLEQVVAYRTAEQLPDFNLQSVAKRSALEAIERQLHVARHDAEPLHTPAPPMRKPDKKGRAAAVAQSKKALPKAKGRTSPRRAASSQGSRESRVAQRTRRPRPS